MESVMTFYQYNNSDPFLFSTGVSIAVGVGGFLLVGVASAEWAGPSVVLSALLASATAIVTGGWTR